MTPTCTGRGILKPRHPCMWEVNNQWLDGFPIYMRNIQWRRSARTLFLAAQYRTYHEIMLTTPLSWPIETAFDVAVGHCDGISLMEYLLIMYWTAILQNIRF